MTDIIKEISILRVDSYGVNSSYDVPTTYVKNGKPFQTFIDISAENTDDLTNLVKKHLDKFIKIAEHQRFSFGISLNGWEFLPIASYDRNGDLTKIIRSETAAIEELKKPLLKAYSKKLDFMYATRDETDPNIL